LPWSSGAEIGKLNEYAGGGTTQPKKLLAGRIVTQKDNQRVRDRKWGVNRRHKKKKWPTTESLQGEKHRTKPKRRKPKNSRTKREILYIAKNVRERDQGLQTVKRRRHSPNRNSTPPETSSSQRGKRVEIGKKNI